MQESTHSAFLIFVGETGATIYQHFCQRQTSSLIAAPLEYLPKSFLEKIDFVRPQPETTLYTHKFAHSDHSVREDQPLEAAIAHMIDLFRYDTKHYKSLEEASSQNSLHTPLIYIVGHISDPQMRVAVKKVRAENILWNISCLYCCYPTEQTQHAQGESVETTGRRMIPDDLAEWQKKVSLDFCYLFGDTSNNDGPLADNRATVDYAVAQALLVLLLVKDPHQTLPTTLKRGTISTCLVTVPRTTILQACQSQVCAFMISDWLAKSEIILQDPSSQKEASRLANENVRNISHLIADGQKEYSRRDIQHKFSHQWTILLPHRSPSTEERLPWFGIAALQDEQTMYIHPQYEDKNLSAQTRALLKHTIFTEHFPSRTWLDNREKNYQAAFKARSEWQQSIDHAWENVYQEAKTGIDKNLKELAENEKKRAAWIIAYVDILDEQLKKLQTRVGQQERKEHIWEEELKSSTYMKLHSEQAATVHLQPTRPALLVLAGLALTSMFVFLLPLLSLFQQRWLAWLIAILIPVTINSIFLVKNFYLPYRQATCAILQYYQRILLADCSFYEREKCIDVIQQLKQHIKYMRKEELRLFQQHFEEDARLCIKNLFHNLSSSHTIFVAKNSYFAQTDEFAGYTFLKDLPGREDGAAAEKIFTSLKDNPAFCAESSSCLCSGIAGPEDFYARIDTMMQPMAEIGRMKDLYALNTIAFQAREMWDDIFKRLKRKHWQEQGEVEDAEHVFLYGPDALLNRAQPWIKQRYPYEDLVTLIPSDILLTPLSEERSDTFPAEPQTAEWFAIALLFSDQQKERVVSTQ